MDRPIADLSDPDVGALWALHRPWIAASLLAWAPRGAGVQADIEDLLQDVALRVMQNRHTLKDPARLRPWLRSIALNTLRDAGRRDALRRGEPTDLATLGDEGAPGERWLERNAARTELAHVLRVARRLPPELAEPLFLRAVRGLSQRDVAETLELSERAVESRLARARQKLREELHRRAGARADRPLEEPPPWKS